MDHENLDWNRYHELLSIGSKRRLTKAEQAEYEIFCPIVEAADQEEYDRCMPILEAGRIAHEKALAQMDRLIDAFERLLNQDDEARSEAWPDTLLELIQLLEAEAPLPPKTLPDDPETR